MLRKITTLTAFFLYVVCAQAQSPIKFGIHVDAMQLSFMGSNNRNVVGAGVNAGFGVGLEMEYYFADNENYAMTFGADFALAKGGKLRYENGGLILPNTELDRTVFTDALTGLTSPAVGDSMDLAAFTTVKYSVNYVQIPLGMKFKTNELGQTYMRAFFHLPIVTVAVPISARGKVYAPDSSATGFVNDLLGYEGTSERETIYGDIFPIQVELGGGAGVEWSPNSDGGLRVTGGIYYSTGLLDMTNRRQIALREPATLTNPLPQYVDRAVRNAPHNITIRIGVVF